MTKKRKLHAQKRAEARDRYVDRKMKQLSALSTKPAGLQAAMEWQINKSLAEVQAAKTEQTDV